MKHCYLSNIALLSVLTLLGNAVVMHWGYSGFVFTGGLGAAGFAYDTWRRAKYSTGKKHLKSREASALSADALASKPKREASLLGRWQLFIAFLLGGLAVAIGGYGVKRCQLPKEAFGRPIKLKGVVVDADLTANRWVKVSLQKIYLPQQHKACGYLVIPLADGLRLVGQQIIFTSKLDNYHPLRNFLFPNPYDKLFMQGKVAKGQRPTHLIAVNQQFFSLQATRYNTYQKIKSWLNHAPEVSLIAGLALGMQQALTPAQWAVLQKTGTTHLQAISGLHMSAIFFITAWLMKKIWTRCARWCEFLPADRAADCLGLLLAFIYALFSGFSLPAQRALWMLLLAVLIKGYKGACFGFDSLFLGLIIILTLSPLATLSQSFWLSFLAVFCILLFGQGQAQLMGEKPLSGPFCEIVGYKKTSLQENIARVGQFLITIKNKPLATLKTLTHTAFLHGSQFLQNQYKQLMTFFVLLPAGLYFFCSVPAISILANAVAIVVVTFMLLPLIILALLFTPIPFVAKPLFKLALILLKPLWYFLTLLAKYPLFLPVMPHSLMLTLLLFACILVIFAPLGLPHKRIGVFLTLGLLLLPKPGLSAKALQITVLDVGQGSAVVVQTADKTLVYDVGAKRKNWDMGEQVVAPFLQKLGVRHIDALVLSHADNDHAGGLVGVLNHLPVRRAYASYQPKYVPATFCQQGDHWQWGATRFSFLWPDSHTPATRNNRSCVLLIEHHGQKILLPGDIEAWAEEQIVAKLAKITLLLAPHHGSLSSSTPAFIRNTHPKYAVFSTGYKNHYHHPHPVIVKRYHQVKTQTFNTQTTGAIQFTFTAGKRPSIKTWQSSHSHNWQQL